MSNKGQLYVRSAIAMPRRLVSTLAAARDLFPQAELPNLFIKIPGSKEGLPAIEEAIFAGIPGRV